MSGKPAKTITTVIVCSLVIYCIIKVLSAIVQTNRSLQENAASTRVLPKDYQDVLASDSLKKITVVEVFNSKERNAVAFCVFANAYHLVIYKIDSVYDRSLPDLIQEEQKYVRLSVGRPYRVMQNSVPFSLKYMGGSPGPVTQLHLTLSGDSIKAVSENDSTLEYYLLCKNFSLTRGNDDKEDIFFKGGNRDSEEFDIPTDILFQRYNGSLYLLFMTPLDNQHSLSPDLLDQLVNQPRFQFLAPKVSSNK